MKKDVTTHNDATLLKDRSEFAEKALQVIGKLPALILSSGGNVDFAIDEALARVGALFNSSRVYVMLDEKDGKYLRNTHEWVNQKTGPVMFSWPLYDYEYDLPSLKKIISEHDVYLGHARNMPDDLSRVLGKQGVLSFIVAPIKRDETRIGLVGMDFCESECDCPAEFVDILHYLSGLVALALERKHFQVMRGKLSVIRDSVCDLEPLLEGMSEEESPSSGGRQSKPTTLLDAERRIIIETLELYNGNKLKTAKHLGLTWPSLDRRCKKLGIEVRRR